MECSLQSGPDNSEITALALGRVHLPQALAQPQQEGHEFSDLTPSLMHFESPRPNTQFHLQPPPLRRPSSAQDSEDESWEETIQKMPAVVAKGEFLSTRSLHSLGDSSPDIATNLRGYRGNSE